MNKPSNYDGSPVKVYLDGKSETVHKIDVSAWIEAGWGFDPETKSQPKEPKAPKEPKEPKAP